MYLGFVPLENLAHGFTRTNGSDTMNHFTNWYTSGDLGAACSGTWCRLVPCNGKFWFLLFYNNFGWLFNADPRRFSSTKMEIPSFSGSYFIFSNDFLRIFLLIFYLFPYSKVFGRSSRFLATGDQEVPIKQPENHHQTITGKVGVLCPLNL